MSQLNALDFTLLKSTIRYFAHTPYAWRIMAAIVRRGPCRVLCKQKPVIPIVPSLRLIFYYVVVYTKHTNMRHTIHERYQRMLRIHTKHRFDPFCRRTRYAIKLHGIEINTNVGQLMFFRWFIRHNIFDTMCRNYEAVTQARILKQQQSRSTHKTESQSET